MISENLKNLKTSELTLYSLLHHPRTHSRCSNPEKSSVSTLLNFASKRPCFSYWIIISVKTRGKHFPYLENILPCNKWAAAKTDFIYTLYIISGLSWFFHWNLKIPTKRSKVSPQFKPLTLKRLQLSRHWLVLAGSWSSSHEFGPPVKSLWAAAVPSSELSFMSRKLIPLSMPQY